MKKIAYLLSIASLFSCNSTPDEARAKNDLTKKIADRSENKVQLIEFKKTDGQERKEYGIDMYSVEFEGKIKYTSPGFASIDPYIPGGTTRSFIQLKDSLPQRSYFDTYVYYKKIDQGREEPIKGAVVYQKKESGWASPSFFIKLTNPSKD